MYDPSWNPATDAQAIDRAFRVGQTRDVVVYRLVTCGTVEEKILRNQIFKNGLQRTVMQAETQRRYFSKQDLRSLFKVGDLASSETHTQVEHMLSAAPSPAEAGGALSSLATHRAELITGGRARAISDYHLVMSLHLISPPRFGLALEPFCTFRA
ncbi:P-loop containing nucleoside triphosphate hydrolase protein [Baffinella frigidus]|nr:P-loop containing nucleoside triphosphate hydrolase protein [Cryptophyta sp. CCMP2293]